MRDVTELEVKRRRVIRSRPVVEFAARMLTCWSESTVAISESSRVRSSASTWIATTKEVGLPSDHVTSIMRSGSRRSVLTFGQSARCTLTPWPRVTKPTIPSPGTGVQQRAELHPDIGEPLDHDALGDVGLRDPHRPRERHVGRHVLVAGAADASCQPRDHRLRRDMPLAHRDVQRVQVGVLQIGDHLLEHLVGRKPLERKVLLRIWRCSSSLP